jgi:hypothetical protein
MMPASATIQIDTMDARSTSGALIVDWATRVIGLWERSRIVHSADVSDREDFGAACRVRDQLNNRLGRVHPDDSQCGERSLDTLRDADAFFLQFTIESSTAEALSGHNHYAHRSEWWWRRSPRVQAA